jgi:hypothetical protein
MNEGSVWLGIDFGRGMEKKTKEAFNTLLAQKEALEAEYGEPVEWDSQEKHRSCFIYYTVKGVGGLASPETWDKLQNTMIDAMIHLDKVTRPRVAGI